MLRRLVALLTGGVLALGLLGAPSASGGVEAQRHKRKPSVTYTLTAGDIDQATQGASVTYEVKRLPKRGAVVLQSHSPYDGGWSDEAVATQKSGTLQAAPWSLLGEYAVRVVVRDAKGKQVARAGRSTVRAFATIPLEQFARSTVVGTVAIDGQTFPYATRLQVGYLFRFEHTSCTKASITVGSDEVDFTVRRLGHVIVNVPEDTLKTVETTLEPGSLAFYSVVPGYPGSQIYANGTAYCYTKYGTTES